jgi:hypothetical protein
MEVICFFCLGEEPSTVSSKVSCEDGFGRSVVVVRFRFPEPEDEGDDILRGRVPRLCDAQKEG